MQGIYAPLTTPFRDQQLDEQAFVANLAYYEQTGLVGYLILGSSAESPLLTPAEGRRLLELARQATRRRLLAGVAHESTAGTLKGLEEAARLGADYGLVRTPAYFGSQADQLGYYLELAQHSPLPLVVYQIPQYTGIKLPSELLLEVASHPRIVGIKDSAGDLACLQEIMASRPEGFDYLLGAAGVLLPGLMVGASGGILALANVLPEACVRVFDLFKLGQFEPARQLAARLIPLNRAIGASAGYGLAGLKYAMSLRGLVGGPPRSPLRPLEPAHQSVLEALVNAVEP
ncbi:MAG: dihydrodipicolinate synthase family protein [Vulcanimicrobiota bacterium]